MTEGDGLCSLQVGVAGHNGVAIALGLVSHGSDQGFDKPGDLVDLISQIHPDIQRHLIVTAAGSVELFAHISQPLGQHLLYKHMDVFAFHVNGQLAAFQIFQNTGKTFCKLLCLSRCDDALG